MGVPVYNFNDFTEKFNKLKKQKSLCGFFLYDSSPTQKIIKNFTRKRADWLDELAGFGKIYFFFPLHRSESREFQNPSLKIAGIFNIPLKNLPCIILFNNLPTRSKSPKFICFELEETLFTEENTGNIQRVFEELFQILSSCQKTNKTPDQLLEEVRLEVEKLKRANKMQSRINFFKQSAKGLLIALPQKAILAIAEGFGKALGEQTMKPG